ncbi:hypothetical protein BLNAU_568 [Blattamonas nauphoetae]|uniref:Rho-GAP domain-containing protein n=1 Tax=Blattamonas nauphoetae TaxID=2049346 RepID=A0ABQ9YLL0_9EUKA|nr:hypothetical protein BLNAU_568 [Blattamonas nauphoetae]
MSPSPNSISAPSSDSSQSLAPNHQLRIQSLLHAFISIVCDIDNVPQMSPQIPTIFVSLLTSILLTDAPLLTVPDPLATMPSFIEAAEELAESESDEFAHIRPRITHVVSGLLSFMTTHVSEGAAINASISAHRTPWMQVFSSEPFATTAGSQVSQTPKSHPRKKKEIEPNLIYTQTTLDIAVLIERTHSPDMPLPHELTSHAFVDGNSD